MEKYKRINTLIGWIVFAIASFVYLSTMEPTASFWDCGEFIASAYKLEVGHPPGAPFFMLLGNFFTKFAGSNLELVAIMANSLSALASAFTILFLFWTITHLVSKIFIRNPINDLKTNNILIIMGSGAVGALAYTFSDTFWFSAVEGEVYATSSLFTAIVFWAILKWENEAGKKNANRWIIFIAYMVGLSIGVHLLNLLAIPAIVFVYYYKKYKPTSRGFVFASLVSVVLLAVVMYMIIPGFVKVATWFELLFVNTFGLPYSSGLIFYLILLFSLLAYGIYKTYINKKALYNTILVAFTVIIIGYSSFALIMIRSLADPPMDQNNPDNLFSMLYYLNREQYGDRPLFQGKYYDAPLAARKDGAPIYAKLDGKYKIIEYKPEHEYDSRFTTFFPRMYSDDERHVAIYKKWGRVKGRPVRVANYKGEAETINVPTFKENMRFFFSYQLKFMYFRYFMWNFSGKQNDIQATDKTVLHGNWISGFPFVDNPRLGPQELLPSIYSNHKARNTYYMLPLILGIIGMVFQTRKSKHDSFVVALLFIMTGIAIVVYLNQTPMQPRERDYAYAGSFYAFAIWIGIGVAGIYDTIKTWLPKTASASLAVIICLALVPGIMAAENWDDHDRSGRYTARDFAYNYLQSCAPNAILFTNGDNDTFPLWYAQEVEGIRTDIKVINLSYLTADWYINQMTRKVYESDPIPLSMKKEHYFKGTRDYLPIYNKIKKYVELKQIINFALTDNDNYKTPSPFRRNEKTNYIPSKRAKITIDKEQVIKNKVVHPSMTDQIVDSMTWSIPGSYILKNKLVVLDMLSSNNWERPIYYAITVASENYMNLQPYFQVEGLAYRIVPIRFGSNKSRVGGMCTDITYDNMMNKFKWGRIQYDDVYLDENNLRMLSNFRNNFARLADELYIEGKKDSCVAVIKKCFELMPDHRVPYDYFITPITEVALKVGETGLATQALDILYGHTLEELRFFMALDMEHLITINHDARLSFYVLQEIIRIANKYKLEELAKNATFEMQDLYKQYSNKLGS